MIKTDPRQPDIQIDLLSPPGDGTLLVVLPKLKGSLVTFAPDLTYNEATGKLITDEFQEKRTKKLQKNLQKFEEKQQKKHWW